jgi:hypothetical protein
VSLRVRILQIDVPAAALDVATAFWSEALGATPVPSAGVFVHLHDARSVVEVHVQPLGDGPAGYHLDLEVVADGYGVDAAVRSDDRDAEVARLVDLGATAGPVFADGYTVVHDPAGLPLCVIEPDAAPRNPLAPRRGDRGYLDAIFLDVPAGRVDAEVAFWLAALGATPGPVVDEYVAIADVLGPDGPLDLEVQRIGGDARIHIDLSTDDVDAEVTRLRTLGATHVASVEDWVTLADPVGNLFCVVPS